MNEIDRKSITLLFEQVLGIDPNTVAREGANEYGYFKFTGNIVDNSREKVWVPWTVEQLGVIDTLFELFDIWFSEA